MRLRRDSFTKPRDKHAGAVIPGRTGFPPLSDSHLQIIFPRVEEKRRLVWGRERLPVDHDEDGGREC
jgi:hypothetical protein